jgi:hypothetical protein
MQTIVSEDTAMLSIQVELEFDELLKIIDQLPKEKKRFLSEHLAAEVMSSDEDEELDKPRILGMHPGAFQPADDFDDPLPDEFWLGEDA